jgi:hypothetical protein
MKYSILFIIFLSVGIELHAQSSYEVIKDGTSEKLLGHVNLVDLQDPPYFSWYSRYYDEYALDSSQLEMLAFEFDSVEVYFGTWCGDSKRNVPAFLKCMEKFDATSKLRLIGVGNTPYMYKQSPDGRHVGKNIHHVPTFIFYQGATELGRIIEYPRQSFEKDLISLAEGTYRPNYYLIETIDSLLSTSRPSGWEEGIAVVLEKHGMPQTAYELNTYARVLKAGERFAECKMILEVNHDLFPEKWFTAYYLGLMCENLGDFTTAIIKYELASINSPYSATIKSKIESLQLQYER